MVLKTITVSTVAALLFIGCASSEPKVKQKEVLVYKIDVNTKKAVAKLIDKVKELEKNSSSKNVIVRKATNDVRRTKIDTKIIEFINEKQSNK